LGASAAGRFGLSVVLTFIALFAIGSLRALVTVDRWWIAGLEMLLLGALVAGAAYGSGALVASLLAGAVE
jgi:VIT1/CCC1 family predicted Fe2+/Mn2+ transporter